MATERNHSISLKNQISICMKYESLIKMRGWTMNKVNIFLHSTHVKKFNTAF